MKCMKTVAVLIASLLLTSMTGLSLEARANEHECEGFLPKNNLRIPENSRAARGISRAQFDRVLDRIERLYEGEFRARGARLNVNRDWSNSEVNAFATQDGDLWTIHMIGGIARHRALTPDGFALVACHEIGHHIGGAPKYPGSNSWASNEGESDYFATLKCLRRFFAQDDNEKALSQIKLDSTAVRGCEAEHRNRADEQLCIRTAMAGLSLASLFQDLSDDGSISFDHPDSKKVSKTAHTHPRSQCRLDTYFNGSRCTAPVSQALSDHDYRSGSCHDTVNQAAGVRPRCWFKP